MTQKIGSPLLETNMVLAATVAFKKQQGKALNIQLN